MPKSLKVIVSLLMIASIGFGETTVTLVGSSATNEQTQITVNIDLTNTEAVAGLQFALKDGFSLPVSLIDINPSGRADSEPYEDTDGDGFYTPGENYTDVNSNGAWDEAFFVKFNDNDSTIRVLVFDVNGNSIQPGSGPICSILYSIPASVSDEVIDLVFFEDIEADPPYLLTVVDSDANTMHTIWRNGYLIVGGIGDSKELPNEFALAQNYPNPFNPMTTIEYSVSEESEINLGVYNLLGQEIYTLVNAVRQPGFYSTIWNGLTNNGVRVESGIYLYKMSSTAGFSTTKKLVLLK